MKTDTNALQAKSCSRQCLPHRCAVNLEVASMVLTKGHLIHIREASHGCQTPLWEFERHLTHQAFKNVAENA